MFDNRALALPLLRLLMPPSRAGYVCERTIKASPLEFSGCLREERTTGQVQDGEWDTAITALYTVDLSSWSKCHGSY